MSLREGNEEAASFRTRIPRPAPAEAPPPHPTQAQTQMAPPAPPPRATAAGVKSALLAAVRTLLLSPSPPEVSCRV